MNYLFHMIIAFLLCYLLGVDNTLHPVEITGSLGVDTTIAATIAPAGDTNEIMVLVSARLARAKDVRAARVTLAGIGVATDITTAHLKGRIDAGAEALLATGISKMQQVHLEEIALDGAAAEGGTPASGQTVLTTPVLRAIWNADWDNVVVVDDQVAGKSHQSNVVSKSGRAVLRVHDNSFDSHDLNPALLVKTIVTSNVQHVGVDVRRAKNAVSSGDGPSFVDDRASANEGTIASHASHPAMIAKLGCLTTNHLV